MNTCIYMVVWFDNKKSISLIRININIIKSTCFVSILSILVLSDVMWYDISNYSFMAILYYIK